MLCQKSPASTLTAHTATIRQLTTQTPAATSVREPLSKSLYVTPGVSERTMSSTATSTSRRLGGLSRFGGPARRVPAADDVKEDEKENIGGEDNGTGIEQLLPSVGAASSSSANLAQAGPSQPSINGHSLPTGIIPRDHRRGSPSADNMLWHPAPPTGVDEESARSSRHRLTQSATVIPSTTSRLSPPPEERPFRPFARHLDQENLPIGKPPESGFRLLHKTSPLPTELAERPPPQPLRPAVQYAADRPDVRSVAASTSLRATRPAPILNHRELGSLPQTAPHPQAAVDAAAQLPMQANTAPAQPAPLGKRSFIVSPSVGAVLNYRSTAHPTRGSVSLAREGLQRCIQSFAQRNGSSMPSSGWPWIEPTQRHTKVTPTRSNS
jgi:serine/threonine-protein kinase TTK/MPS1